LDSKTYRVQGINIWSEGLQIRGEVYAGGTDLEERRPESPAEVAETFAFMVTVALLKDCAFWDQ
jgi:hypothetical protein